ncbi:hypothetical protein AWM70_08885 [Paenibacillus yonginensis]|uniref:Core domain-containing protein n=1 Tax=Paenibacillus yonginensis TaxID=1462996 RepID=A0A1B1MZU7_9BACL|nr:iron-sulfur cluster biosynthesis family protein [Paenibacillus yonginensis]ANS74689.1 hypothetical protein AWM70_08885 [Paenibacillus yonginensis]
MRIEMNGWTEQKLNEYLNGAPGCFKLYYDTQDCGCNGVLVLQLLERPLQTDVKAEADPFTFVVDRQQLQQFDEVMRIEADASYPSFKASSDASLYSSNVRIQDLRSR